MEWATAGRMPVVADPFDMHFERYGIRCHDLGPLGLIALHQQPYSAARLVSQGA